MTRVVALLFIASLLFINPASNPLEAAEPPSTPGRFQRKAMRLHRQEIVTQTPAPDLGKLQLPGPGWETRRVFKAGEADKECLVRNGEQIACTPGRFNSSFASADGARHAFLSMSGFMTPQVFKRIFFVTREGVLLKELSIPTGGIPILTAAPKANKLFVLFQQSDGAAIRAYDFNGSEIWKRVIPDVRIASNDKRMLRATSDAKRIIAATNRNHLKNGMAKTLVLDGSGELRAELSSGDAMSAIAPDESWAAIWTKDELRLIDLATDQIRQTMAFPSEEGATFSVDDISPDSRRILVAKRRRNDSKTGAKPRISQLLILDRVAETISESEVNEEMEVSASCRFVGANSIEISSRGKKARYDIAQ